MSDRSAPARAAEARANRSSGAGRGAHIVGATLAKSAEEASHYGYRQYQCMAVADKRNQIALIPHQAEG